MHAPLGPLNPHIQKWQYATIFFLDIKKPLILNTGTCSQAVVDCPIFVDQDFKNSRTLRRH
ncbi:hypothetical protein AT984_13620 [Paucibacter sp. KCTC 42545]|nr:hypothetical protein AT984_13620 [Paucibacter sp. KCTC 42545]